MAGPTSSKRPQARPQYLRGSKNPGRPQYLTGSDNPGRPQYLTGSKTTGTPRRKTDDPRTGTKKPTFIKMRPIKPPAVSRSTAFTDRKVKSRGRNE